MSDFWATEAAMVADFTAWVATQGDGGRSHEADLWTVYAETAGWDLLLVRASDGFQIGVEAKLKLNALVLCQAIDKDRYARGVGPDVWAILAPDPKTVNGVSALARALGVAVIRAQPPKAHEPHEITMAEQYGRPLRKLVPRFGPDLPTVTKHSWLERDEREWPERCPDKRLTLPDYVPDVTGGHPAPLQLTPWKIGALKVAALIERQGWVTRKQIKAVGIDPGRWTQFWLTSIGEARWAPGRHMPDFKAQHPVNYGQIVADFEKWAQAAGLTAEQSV